MSFTLVQQKTATWASGNGSTVPVTFDAAPTNGNLLVAFIDSSSNTTDVTSISGGGVTWARLKRSNVNRLADIWIGIGAVSGGAAITINLSASGSTGIDVAIAEFTPPASATLAADNTNGNSGNGTTITTGSATPTVTGREALILIAARVGGALSSGPTNGFSGITIGATRSGAGYLSVASTTGSYSSGWTAGSGTWDAAIGTVLATPSGGAANPTPGVGALSFTGFAPTVVVGTIASPGTGQLSFSGFAPQWSTSGAQIVARTLSRQVIGGSLETGVGYKELIPGNYDSAHQHPLIVVAAGSGQRGTDNSSQMTDGLATRILADPDAWQATFEPTFIAFPQWPAIGSYGGREYAYPTMRACALAVMAEFNIDPRRVYFFGFSLGAQVVLECIYDLVTLEAGVLAAEGSITNREGLLSGHDPAGSWTSAQAAAEVAALTDALWIRHFNSTADTNATVTASRETRDAMQADWTPNYQYSEGAPVTGLTHVPAYTAVVNDDTQWAALLDAWMQLVPGTGSLVFTGFAPTVSVSNNTNVFPGTGVFSFTGFAPSFSTSDNQSATPGTGALVFTGFAPTILTPRVVSPGTASLLFAGHAPIVTADGSTVVGPDTAELIFTGFAPTVSVSDAQQVFPGTGVLSFTGFAPTVFASDKREVFPGTGALTFAGYAPSVVVSNNQNARPGTGALVFTGYRPAISGNAFVPPLVKSPTKVDLAPSINSLVLAPSTNRVTLP